MQGAGRDAARAEPAEQAPGGGVPPALVARPAVAVPGGGLPCLSPANPAFSLLFCPHPPARARRALFPGGKGEVFSFLMQGASPLASPGLGGARHGLNLRSRHPAGAYPRRWRLDQPLRCLTGACPAGCLLTLPLVYFVSPIPPTPFPSGEGGDFRLFYARGFAPCIPGAGRSAARALLVENRFFRLQWCVGTRWGGGNPGCKKPPPPCTCTQGL